jgi:hypothetical protein
MARQGQRGGRQATGTKRNRLDSALEATQRQSVPILPTATDTSPHPATPISTRPLTAAPSGPVRRTLADATGLHPASASLARTTGNLRTRDPQHVSHDTDRKTGHPAMDPRAPLDEPLRGDRAMPPLQRGVNLEGSAAIPDRLTLSVPTLTGSDLPAVPPDMGDRQIAPRAAPQSQAVFIPGSRKAPRLAATLVPRRIGPRSFVAQFIIAMVTVMTLFSVLALVSPLGRGAVFAGTFQTNAYSAPWIPTPTHTPKPKPAYVPPAGANPGQQAIINDIVAVFGSYAQGAINVARCESDFDPNARNPYAIGNSHAEGVFQILYPSTWDSTSYSGYSPYNYDANIRAAYQIFARDGHTWREWACQP